MKFKVFMPAVFFFMAFNSSFAQSVFEDAAVLSKYLKDNTINIGTARLEKEHRLEKMLDSLREKSTEDGLAQKDLDALKKKIADGDLQNKIIKDPRRDTVFAILQKYGLSVVDGKLDPSNDNPFLKDVVLSGSTRSDNKAAKAIKSVASSIGGLDVTNIANAVSDIMIEHAKQELTVAFFDRFKKFAEENPEFGILFPKTTHNLENLLSYKYPEMLPALRSGFLEDVRQLAFRLDDVLNLPRYQEIFKDLPEVAIAIRSLRLVHELETGASNPAEVIKQFAAFKEWKSASPNVSPKFKTAGSIVKISALFSESIRSSNTDEVWVSGKELKKLFHDQEEALLQAYLGLLFQKAKLENVAYIPSTGAPILFTDMMKAQKDNIFTFRNKLQEFVDLADRVNNAYDEIKEKKGEGLSNDDYYSYINTSLDVVEYGFSLAELFGEDTQTAEQYLVILRQSNDLFRNIYTKEYNQAISNSLDILDKIRELAKERKAKVTIINAEALASEKDMSVKNGNLEVAKTASGYELKNNGERLRSFAALDVTIVEKGATYYISSKDTDEDPLEKLLTFVQEIKPYALFIANMIEAESEEDIKNAIENAILPVGSSSIKKFSISNISVQSYLGPRFSLAESSEGKTTWNNTLGVMAPIGVAFSWGGKGNVFKDPASFSVFLVAFDLGAIVDYKLKEEDGETTSDYKVELGQILAPGAYLVWGLPCKIPLSIGAGTQYGPGLITGNNGIEAVEPGWSARIFIGVDIPFFTLHNKPRNNLPKK